MDQTGRIQGKEQRSRPGVLDCPGGLELILEEFYLGEEHCIE